MKALRSPGRRGVILAAALSLAAAAACGRKQVPPEEYNPDAGPAQETAAPPPAPPPPAPPGAAAPAPAPLTPEQDSAQEARAFARRQQSMESYESCMEKVAGIEEPTRTTLREACARTRRPARP